MTRRNYFMKSISIIFMLLAMLFSCEPENGGNDSNNSGNNTTQNGNNTGNTDEDNKDDVVTTGKIVGKATYTNTANHAGIQVTLVSSDGIVAYDSQISSRSRSDVAVMKNVVTSESGEYSFTNVKEGVYTIYASSDDSTEKAVLTNVVVQANKVVTAADLNLTATGSICGRVTLDGKENGNLGIMVFVASTSYMSMTDDLGVFTISDVPAGADYQIVIMKGDYCTIWSKVSVEAGKENMLGDKNITSQSSDDKNYSFIWQGSSATPPANPEKYWAYFNTTDGSSYIYDGEKWTLLAQAGKDGEDGTNGNGGEASVEHKIIYELNEGTNSPYNPNLFLEYLDVYLNSPTRDGYYFAGWYETADFSSEIIIGWDAGEKRTDVTLYAKWVEKDVSRLGVFTYTLNIEDISTAWGGTTTSPSFSVILLTDEQVEACAAAGSLKISPEHTPEYQISAFGNMKITDTAQTGNFGVWGTGYNYYDGIAATVTDTTVTLFVDMAKLNKTHLKALFATNSNGMDEQPITEDDIVDLFNYKPYVLALGTQEADSDNYVANIWSGDLMKMTVGATFPEDLQYVTPTCNDLKYIYGDITNSEQTKLTDNSFTFTYMGGIYSDFYFSDGTYYFTYGGVTIDSLDTEIQLIENGSWSSFADGVLTEGKIYTITLIVKGEHEAYVKVTEAQPGSISITSTPYKTSYYVGEELNLDGLTVEATYSDGSTFVVTVTSDMVSGFDSSVAGTQTLTVTYEDCTVNFDVEVIENSVSNINILNYPSKTSYYVGEELDVSGLEIEAVYSDGSTSVVTVTSDMVSGFDSSVAGTQTLTVTYEDCTVTFDVEVIEE